MSKTFRSLSNPNYRLWFIGAVISNIGTWLQRTAQDWIVIAELSDKNASAVGLVVFLQFAPQILLLPITGWTVDKFNRRKILIVTQVLMAILALALGLLILSNSVALWQVCVCAFLLGCVAAFDAPARQSFVSDIVNEKELSNAVSLNSLSFNTARLVGPAIAGVLIAWIGAGWVFLLNAVSFIPMLTSLYRLRSRLSERENVVTVEVGGAGFSSNFFDGFRYIAKSRKMTTVALMTFLICSFGMNFAVYLSSMTVHVFKGHSDQYGFLISTMAIGSMTGAVITARRIQPTMLFITIAASGVAISSIVAAYCTSFYGFCVALVFLGLSLQAFNTSSNTMMQLSTERHYRGRVMAIVIATALGSTALGGPVVGAVADWLGPRWGVGIGGLSALIAVGFGVRYLREKTAA
ncbi:Enterobactin exporter EntS [Marinomonas spartinae]|uniref:Enterobactin exporter EntS n=1 Tax=Marinomonas spartinae TaxID=1792290 RepID=A0A1A8T0W6_9GAMM|nr:MFS transporter [Marinomonas spartinae]SBS25547.1 Enterobactin exporter EntS [Marinomonas spartinae]SBS39617.1 Enterobactin exporter EntS [Marinomonas spartinae]